MSSYRDLKAWQVCDRLAHSIYDVSGAFPVAERFGLTAQLRRAALSAPTNLAEGAGRFAPGDTLRFFRIAAGSLAEVDYLLRFAHEREYLGAPEYESLASLTRQASNLVAALARGMQRHMAGSSPRHQPR